MGAVSNKNIQYNRQRVNNGENYIFLKNIATNDEILEPIEIKNEISLQEIRDQLKQRLHAITIQLFLDGQPISEDQLQERINLQNINQYSQSQLQYKARQIKIIEITTKEIPVIQFDEDVDYKKLYENLKNQYAKKYFEYNSLMKQYEAMVREYQQQIDQLKQNFTLFQQQNLKQKSEIFQTQQKFQQQSQQLGETQKFYKNHCSHILTPNVIEDIVYKAFMSNTIALCPQCNPKKISDQIIRTVCPQLGELHILKILTQQLTILEENIQVQNELEVRKCYTLNCQFFCIWDKNYDTQKQQEYYCPNCLIFSVKKSLVNPDIFRCQIIQENSLKKS